MAKRKTRSVSLPPDLDEYASQLDNFSGFVREQLEEHRAAHQMTAEERIQRQLEERKEEKREVEQKEQRLDGEIAELEAKLEHHRGRRNETYEEVLNLFHGVVRKEEQYQEKRIKNGKNPTDLPRDDLLDIYHTCDLHAINPNGVPIGEYVTDDLEDASLPTDVFQTGRDVTEDEVDAAEDLFNGLTPREEHEVEAALDEYFDGE
ncbi:hypothetical protein [Natrinema sp. 74]|uniref:hypothetical protein n=1 Tax=Natrinema sp. 74 TaxID=3384159 RepID=UPI0038D3D70A